MNLLKAVLTGRKDSLTRKKLRLDVYLVAVLVLILAVFGTVIKNANNPKESHSASVIAEEIKETAPSPKATFAITEFIGDSGSEKSTENPETAKTTEPAPSPTATPEEIAAEAEIIPVKDESPILRESEVIKNAAPVTVPVVSTPVPAPVVPAAPVVVPPPVAPAPVIPTSSYPVSSIPAVPYRTTIHLNMRSGPGTEYGITGAGPTGTTVNGTGRASGIWFEVQLGGTTGWMSSQYLQKIETGSNSVASLQSFAGSRLGNDTQLQCLITLWNRESNWNYTAINPAFSPSKPAIPAYQAYGIAQAAPGNRMATFGSDWETNPRTQILWGLDYIAGRYGAPCAALDHSYSVGWY